MNRDNQTRRSTGGRLPSAYLGLGTNLGDRIENLRLAVRLLSEDRVIRVCSAANLYETSPVGGPPGQSNYYNTVVGVATELDAPALLEHLLNVERRMGRVRAETNGPRIIDIDLLLCGGIVRDTANLTIPHPRLHARGFVLEPLAEVAPELRHPVIGETIRELRDRLSVGDSFVQKIDSFQWCGDVMKENAPFCD